MRISCFMNSNDRNGRTARFSSQRVVSNKIKDIAVCGELLKMLHAQKFQPLVLLTVKGQRKYYTQKVFVRTLFTRDFKRFG